MHLQLLRDLPPGALVIAASKFGVALPTLSSRCQPMSVHSGEAVISIALR
jgi:hypothetical protein